MRNKITHILKRWNSDYKSIHLNNLESVEKYPSFSSNILDFKDIFQKPSGVVSVCGRVKSKRIQGKNLAFIDLVRNQEILQVVLKRDQVELFDKNHIGIGDVYRFDGVVQDTRKGQTSLYATKFKLLAPCLHRIPEELKDDNTKHRLPWLNFLVDQEAVNNLQKRFKAINYLRGFLHKQGFIEIETPVLSVQSGGANAKPFKTHLNTFELDLEMRIAPELYLKQLIIGGFDKIFEIGKQFRNEGIDATHNPEFTTCEIYQTYTTVDNMMAMTENLFRNIFQEINGKQSTVITIEEKEVEIDFSKPFSRIHIVPKLESLVGKLPPLDNESIPQLLDVCKVNGITIPFPQTLPQILDKMVSELIEPLCIQPTFLIGHPKAMSPLSKCENDIADRFELFIGRKEYVNSYSELNDPEEQLKRFQSQQEDRNKGDGEAQQLDSNFCKALEYGLPPTVGWGLGIDRLVMLLCGTRRIRDVIAFPIIKPEK
ncbi:hypothetical protein HDV06_000829 [Boothiomyces sp. JEL0866]|nr:hypothetical protein HDV06_000829 [Boothiomyces sp. JEL0866]